MTDRDKRKLQDIIERLIHKYYTTTDTLMLYADDAGALKPGAKEHWKNELNEEVNQIEREVYKLLR